MPLISDLPIDSQDYPEGVPVANPSYVAVVNQLEAIQATLTYEINLDKKDRPPEGTIAVEALQQIIHSIEEMKYELWECLSGQMEGA